MLTAKAVIHCYRDYLLGCSAVESPVVLQLGGADAGEMAEAASIGESYGYSEININVGCPSDRVLSGRFGACLMAEPETVSSCVRAMQHAVSVPVSVKCRLGIDRNDSYDAVADFVEQVAMAGCQHFIVHARKAWLDGLSPKENRTIPPLRYEHVYRLKQQFPECHISINGGIDNWQAVRQHLQHVDGVMVGRAAYYSPALLCHADSEVFASLPNGCRPDASVVALADVARAYARYMQTWCDHGVKPSAMVRHVVALIQGVPGAKQFRRHLSENMNRTGNMLELVDDALANLLLPRHDQRA